MALYIEDYVPVVKYNGLNTQGISTKINYDNTTATN